MPSSYGSHPQGREEFGQCKHDRILKDVWICEVKTKWLERQIKEAEDRVDQMMASKEENHEGAIEHGKMRKLSGLGILELHIFMLCFLNLVMNTTLASARPWRDEWRTSTRYTMTMN
jgi:hypothetical protein